MAWWAKAAAVDPGTPVPDPAARTMAHAEVGATRFETLSHSRSFADVAGWCGDKVEFPQNPAIAAALLLEDSESASSRTRKHQREAISFHCSHDFQS
jgi:hypothetical protein